MASRSSPIILALACPCGQSLPDLGAVSVVWPGRTRYRPRTPICGFRAHTRPLGGRSLHQAADGDHIGLVVPLDAVPSSMTAQAARMASPRNRSLILPDSWRRGEGYRPMLGSIDPVEVDVILGARPVNHGSPASSRLASPTAAFKISRRPSPTRPGACRRWTNRIV